jgi:nucleotide-binding universal stress UspA family protein
MTEREIMSQSKARPKIGPSLQKVVVAVEPDLKKTITFEGFAKTIRWYQKQNILPTVSIASIIHSALYSVTNAWYRQDENRYAKEAEFRIDQSCRGKFGYSSIDVLKGDASTNEYLVEEVSEYLNKAKAKLLVVLSSNRRGLPHWIVGSFAETAAFTATKPVLVLKPQVTTLEFSSKPRFTLTLDSSTKYTREHLNWVVELALPSQAQVDIVNVKPAMRGMLASLQKNDYPATAVAEIQKFEQGLRDAGVSTSLSYLNEKGSIAKTIVEFSDKKKAWGIITISAERGLVRKLLLGSTSRKVLSMTKRPFFTVRF